jgi:hypothetical protein
MTVGAEMTAPATIPPDPRRFRWSQDIDQRTARRLARATKEDTIIHLFKRSQGGHGFAYLGRSRISVIDSSEEHVREVEFRLLDAEPIQGTRAMPGT